MKRAASPLLHEETNRTKKPRSDVPSEPNPRDPPLHAKVPTQSRSPSKKADYTRPQPLANERHDGHPRVKSSDNSQKSLAQQNLPQIPDNSSSTPPQPATLKRPRSRSRSPPRQRKRPGGASRIDNAAKQAVLQRQQAREEEAKAAVATRGVQDVVREHYNAVPQRGREWRRTDSRIKGLRSFNNWVKSVIIHKFSPNEDSSGGGHPLLILDLGCGKGGDLAKWAQAPQEVELYVGIDPAEVSIEQAKERYSQMTRGGGGGGRGRGGRGGFRGSRPQWAFHAEFIVQDAFGQSIGNIPIIQNVGFDTRGSSRWGEGGFDVVAMMFCMHYAFETETKTRGLLRNIAGALKKGGKFIGTIPNSDVLRARIVEFHERQSQRQSKSLANGVAASATEVSNQHVEGIASAPQTSATEEVPNKPKEPTPYGGDAELQDDDAVATWGNSIYRVRFPGKTPPDGIFRPPFGWKYNYFLDEAVEVPEYVVPWEAFRGLAEDFNLELQYRKPFVDVWREENNHPVFSSLSERMGVRDRNSGTFAVTDEEMEAVGMYKSPTLPGS
ncbi:MAG: hypothetical protein LQ351_007295 [Letrouitia transgressa]|nr:MAG: hypothetical protein LQ351_007295 [Letrouitia transgressa]